MSHQCNLTQADLEEYNSQSTFYDQPVFHHQKQSSYAQSEGYHSYVSSSDSSSATPFLDRLRQESELLSRQSNHYLQKESQLDDSSATAVNINGEHLNSSESSSSTETLKWLGSISDASLASNESTSVLSESVSSSSQLIVHSSKVCTPKRHTSESVLYMNDDISLTNEVDNSIIEITDKTKQQRHDLLLSDQSQLPSQSIYSHFTQCYPKQQITVTSELKDIKEKQKTLNNLNIVSNITSTTTPVQNSVQSTTTNTTQFSASSTLSPHRTNNKLFPISTYTEPVCNTKQDIDSSLQSQQSSYHSSVVPRSHPVNWVKMNSQSINWQLVAGRIYNFERQQQQHQLFQQNAGCTQKYSYIDPSKTHRVPNPALKAFQKNAVQSYYKRQQSERENNENNSQMNAYNNTLRSSLSSSQSSIEAVDSLSKKKSSPLNRQSLPSNFLSQASSVSSSSSSSLSLSYATKSERNSTNQHPSTNSNLIKIQKLLKSNESLNDCGIPPPPPPRPRSLMPIRRSSSESDYTDFRENLFCSSDKTSSEIMNNKESFHLNTVSKPDKSSLNECGVPPPPPPRGKTSLLIRRTSSASEYAFVRDKNSTLKQKTSKEIFGPIVMGPIISVDDWVPERPPKNPHLRIPSPDLPPPPPIQTHDSETNLVNQDEPLPPPPPEILKHVRNVVPNDTEYSSLLSNRHNNFIGLANRSSFYRSTTSFDSSNSLTAPPSLPKKPSSSEIITQHHQSYTSSLMQSNKIHKVILNAKLENPLFSFNDQQQQPTLSDQDCSTNRKNHQLNSKGNDTRQSIRKRSHFTSTCLNDSISSPKINSTIIYQLTKPPPPLKPRMSIKEKSSSSTSILNNMSRCSSKTSYHIQESESRLISTDTHHNISHNERTENKIANNELSQKSYNRSDKHPINSKLNQTSMFITSPPPFSSVLTSSTTTTTTSMSNLSNSQSSCYTGAYYSETIVPQLVSPSLPSSLKSSKKSVDNHTTSANYHHQQRTKLQMPSYCPNYKTNNCNDDSNYQTSHISESKFTMTSSDKVSSTFASSTTAIITTTETEFTKSHSVTPATKLNFNSNEKFISSYAQSINANKNQVNAIMTETNSNSEKISASNLYCDSNDNNKTNKISSKEQLSPTEEISIAPAWTSSALPSDKVNDQKTINKDNLRENIENINQLQSKLVSTRLANKDNECYIGNKTSNDTSIQHKENEMTTQETDKSQQDSEHKKSIFSEAIITTDNQKLELNKVSSSEISSNQIIIESPIIFNSFHKTESDNQISGNNSIRFSDDADNLKLMQRTEIILQVNAPTCETASQTDESIETEFSLMKLTNSIDYSDNYYTSDSDSSNGTNKNQIQYANTIFLTPKIQLQEEIDCDILSNNLASKLPVTHKLCQILLPKSYKTSSDYVSDMFNMNFISQKSSTKRDVGTSTLIMTTNNNQNECLSSKLIPCLTSAIENTLNPSSDASLNTAVESNIMENEIKDNEPFTNNVPFYSEDDNKDNICDLIKNKEELINCLARKIQVLNNKQIQIFEETSKNERLGNDISLKIVEKLRPIDVKKFRSFIDDLGHITMLLLSLSSRLAKIENLIEITENQTEKEILKFKRDRLIEQLKEAKNLKRDIDRRGAIVSKVLEDHFTNDEYADYDLFINTKEKLIVISKETTEKIKISEEQLRALRDSFIQDKY